MSDPCKPIDSSPHSLSKAGKNLTAMYLAEDDSTLYVSQTTFGEKSQIYIPEIWVLKIDLSAVDVVSYAFRNVSSVKGIS